MMNMYIKVVIFTFLLVLDTTLIAEEFTYSKVQVRDFELVEEFEYKTRKYLEVQPILINAPLMGNEGPDRELIAMLSAISLGDYQFWLEGWDVNSKKEFNKAQAGPNKFKELQNLYKDRDFSSLVKLVSWLEVGQTVWITYHLELGDGSVIYEDIVPFVIEDYRWRASLALRHSRFIEKLKEIAVHDDKP